MSPAQWFLNAGLALAILLPDALGDAAATDSGAVESVAWLEVNNSR